VTVAWAGVKLSAETEMELRLLSVNEVDGPPINDTVKVSPSGGAVFVSVVTGSSPRSSGVVPSCT
jgi:hypothetical protein